MAMKKDGGKRKNIIIVALGLLLSHHILAQQTLAAHQALETDLSVQVNQFFQQQYSDKESQVKVVIKPRRTSGHNVMRPK